ncbi:L-cystine-binding protein FliY [Caprobacter fermentans]|uniref:L-cystine-binding protein FliY n=1 Tax=Caproicibacter fermentans TaxID=2576756 RepID=A0A6N8HWR9_9FIRM|nr:amino acid ABC transporter substrate-binding protein [Caproicibacter fermentans]MVB09843.1 L-cystine-binding protein FliY [Caproicibacter fermentans]
MKKLIVFLMTAALTISFAGCSSAPAATQQTPSAAVSSGAASGSSAPDGSWDKVKSAGKLVLGLDKAFPPMGYVDTQTGELVGFDIDLAKEACKRLGIELSLQPIDWDNKTAELNNGNVDCLWNGFSKTSERGQEFALSIPYMKNNQIILVKAGSNYKGLGGLAGKTVGVQADSSAETALNDNPDFKSSLKSVVKIDDYSKAVLEIQNGTIDAIAIDEIVARYYLTKNPGAYSVLQDQDGKDASLATEDYVVAFRKSDIALKEKIEGALKDMAKDGTMADLSKKWFGKDVTTVGK